MKNIRWEDLQPTPPALPAEDPTQGDSYEGTKEDNYLAVRAMQDVDEWIEGLQEAVDDKVQEMLAVRHMLVPDMDTLEAHEARVSAELFIVARTHARLARSLWMANRDLKRAEREAKRIEVRSRSRVIYDARSKSKAAYNAKGETVVKNLTQAQVEYLVCRDPEVYEAVEKGENLIKAAENRWAELYEHERGVFAMLEALRLVGSIIPGLQGHKNATTRMRH